MRHLYEWTYANGSTTKANNSSSNNSSSPANDKIYKNRFTKLLDYAKAHSKAERKEIKQLNNNGFHYSEHHNDRGFEWDTDILVATSRFTYDWAFQYWVDGKYDSGEQGKGYEDFIRALGFYINTPNYGTPEYDNLLKESVGKDLLEWQLKPNNSTTTNQPAGTYKAKFTKLVNWLNKFYHGSRLHKLDDTGIDIELWFGRNDLRLTIDFDPKTEQWKAVFDRLNPLPTILGDKSGKGYSALLDMLVDSAAIMDYAKPLCESYTDESSTADEFKIYENLWD
jgi:hypothetical protein